MKAKAILCSIACIACLALAFSSGSLIESRLFISLSVISGLLFFRFASMPASVARKREEKRQSAPAYKVQEAHIEHI
ncbi:MAG TPA: hypothetical protein PLI34_00040 [Saprospiraceae bacterium]|nr:hypothetical protein [Saprospiraceae bacterium]